MIIPGSDLVRDLYGEPVIRTLVEKDHSGSGGDQRLRSGLGGRFSYSASTLLALRRDRTMRCWELAPLTGAGDAPTGNILFL